MNNNIISCDQSKFTHKYTTNHLVEEIGVVFFTGWLYRGYNRQVKELNNIICTIIRIKTIATTIGVERCDTITNLFPMSQQMALV